MRTCNLTVLLHTSGTIGTAIPAQLVCDDLTSRGQHRLTKLIFSLRDGLDRRVSREGDLARSNIGGCGC